MKVAFCSKPTSHQALSSSSSAETNKKKKTKKTKNKNPSRQIFIPKPSPVSIKYCVANLLPDDNDIWIEGSYRSSTTGENIPFFRSFRTGKCCKVEPPTGAHCCIGKDEIQYQSRKIQEAARHPVTKDEIRAMPLPRANPEILQAVLLLHNNEPRRRKWGRWLPSMR